LIVLTDPSEALYNLTSEPLKEVIADYPAAAVKAAAIHALGAATFYGGGGGGDADSPEVLELMHYLLDIVESDGHSVGAGDSGAVVAAALEEWGFLATHMHDLERESPAAMEPFAEQLESSDAHVQIAAGENIALLFEKSYTELEEGESVDDAAASARTSRASNGNGNGNRRRRKVGHQQRQQQQGNINGSNGVRTRARTRRRYQDNDGDDDDTDNDGDDGGNDDGFDDEHNDDDDDDDDEDDDDGNDDNGNDNTDDYMNGDNNSNDDEDDDDDDNGKRRRAPRLVKRYDACRDTGALKRQLAALAAESSRQRSKRDRRALHASFADILRSVERPARAPGPRHQQHVRLGRDMTTTMPTTVTTTTRKTGSGGSSSNKSSRMAAPRRAEMRIDRWWKLHRVRALRRILGGGFLAHYERNATVSDSLP
jgi:hypothetical protein